MVVLQSLNLDGRWDDKVFLVFYIVSNLVLFGGVYWSKFAHMFYKPGAAIQKNLAEADGSRDNLPQKLTLQNNLVWELNVRHQSTINMIRKGI